MPVLQDYKAISEGGDNYAPNAGFMKEYPLWVVDGGGTTIFFPPLIPAKAEIQKSFAMDPRLRGDEGFCLRADYAAFL